MEYTNFKFTKEFILSILEKYNIPKPNKYNIFVYENSATIEYFNIVELGYVHNIFIHIGNDKNFNRFSVSMSWHKDIENYDSTYHQMGLNFFRGESNIHPDETEYVLCICTPIDISFEDFLKLI